MLYRIKHWISGKVLHEVETDSLAHAIESLVARGADLRGADLRGAYLGGAYQIQKLSEAVSIAEFVFDAWSIWGHRIVQSRLGLHPSPDDRALLVLSQDLSGAFCFVLERREIWWWNWQCPDPETVTVLWRDHE